MLGLLNASATTLGGLFVAFALVYGRVSALARRSPVSAPARPLTGRELDSLRAWQRRTLRGFLVTMVALLVFGGACVSYRWLPASLYVAVYLVVLCIASAGLAIHFSGRCPVCDRRIGFQSALLLPPACEICGAVFRPDAPLVPLLGAARAGSVRVVSHTKILGLPLFAVAFGRDPAIGQPRGVARAVLAVGDVAVGFIAVGGLAAGVIAVGGISVGALSVGGVAVGLAALGGLAVGGLAVGGIAIGVYAIGGIAVGLHALGSVSLQPAATTAHKLEIGPR